MVAAGFDHEDLYLTFQEYFERLRDVPSRWGKPTAALLGALMAQVDLGIASIGGKDSCPAASRTWTYRPRSSPLPRPRPRGPRGLPRVQGRRPPRRGARARLRRRRPHPRSQGASRHLSPGRGPGRAWRCARGLHAGLRRRRRGGVQDVRRQPRGHRGRSGLWHGCPLLPLLRQLPRGALRRRNPARDSRDRHGVALRHHDRRLRARRRQRAHRPRRPAGRLGGRARGRLPVRAEGEKVEAVSFDVASAGVSRPTPQVHVARPRVIIRSSRAPTASTTPRTPSSAPAPWRTSLSSTTSRPRRLPRARTSWRGASARARSS